jgi:hypothetical protein
MEAYESFEDIKDSADTMLVWLTEYEYGWPFYTVAVLWRK